MTSPETVLTRENIYFGQATVAGIPCTIGYIKKFKWEWAATQLNTFIVVGETDMLITRGIMEDFSAKCYHYALKNNRGLPRGLSCVGAIAILSGNRIDEEVIGWCAGVTKKHWASFEMPVLYKPNEKRTIRCVRESLWGSIYFSYLTELVVMITSRLSWQYKDA